MKSNFSIKMIKISNEKNDSSPSQEAIDYNSRVTR